MDRTKLTLSSIVLLALAGNLYQAGKDAAPIEIVADVPAEAVKVDDKATLTAMTDAGVKDGDAVTCSCGLNLDGVWRDDLENCSDGKGAAFQRPCGGGSVLYVRDGKAYASKNPAAVLAVEVVAEPK